MKINVSETPAKDAALHITKLLSSSKGNTLVLLSGGSALPIFDYIDEEVLNSNQTFMMMDERFSDDSTINNYLQFSQTNFFKKIQSRSAKVIESSFDTSVTTLEEAAIAMQKTLEYFFKVQENCNVIALFGIGKDGHTASIFPKESEGEFNVLYRTNKLYIPVTEESNTCKERMTITPYFIKNFVNHSILFAIGAEKCDGILQQMKDGSYDAYQIPALIPSRHPTSQLFTDCTTIEG